MILFTSKQVTPDSIFDPDIPVFRADPPIHENVDAFLNGVINAWRSCYFESKGEFRPSVLWLPHSLYNWVFNTAAPLSYSNISVCDYLLRIHPSIHRVIDHPHLTRISVLLEDRHFEEISQKCSVGWLTKNYTPDEPFARYPKAAIIIKS